MMRIPVSAKDLSSNAELLLAYDKLRRGDGICRTALGTWITNYSTCRGVLANEMFSSNLVPRTKDVPSGNLLSMDPPKHTLLRRSVVDALPRRNESFRETVSDSCDNLLQALGQRARIDVVADLAQPLAATIAAQILGLRDVRMPVFRSTLNAIRPLMDPAADQRSIAEGRHASLQLMRAFARIHDDPEGCALGSLRWTVATHASEADATFVFSSVAVMLAHASYENTANFIAGAVQLALAKGDIRDRLIEGDSNVGLLEELLRLCTSAHTVVRRARFETEIDGVEVPAGELVFAILGAANHDPQEFTEPSQIRSGRGPHLAFGHGHHSCPGAGLARDEARIILERFFRTFPSSHRSAPEDWRASITMRGLRSLKVEVGR